MRIIFAGTPEFAAYHLSFLLNQTKHEVIAVFTQPDRPAGRGKVLTASPVKQLALDQQLPIYQPISLKNPDIQMQIEKLSADVMVVVAYGLLLPQAVLELPRYGCINVHASLLPHWRGAAPIQRSIEAGDQETGITVMQMNKGLDTGDMLLKVSCPILETDTAGSLHNKLMMLGGPALQKVLSQIENKQLKPETQDDKDACYADKLTKSEARIDWSASAKIIHQKIRAFIPAPVSFFVLNNDSIRIWDAEVLSTSTNKLPGTILAINKDGIDVCTGDGVLRLLSLQLPGKKAMCVADVLNGNLTMFKVGQDLTN